MSLRDKIEPAGKLDAARVGAPEKSEMRPRSNEARPARRRRYIRTMDHPPLGSAPKVGLAPTMGLTTAEGTAQILTPRIARVREKENPAVPTAGQAPAQRRLGPQNRSQQRVIREHQSDDSIASIPIFDEPKMRRDLSCQKPRFWLWIPT
jgi:hypothetical protein